MLAAPVELPFPHDPDPAGFSFAHLDFHPEIIVGLLLLQGVYLLGVGPLRGQFGWAQRMDRRKAGVFFLGVLTLAIALLPPIHDLSEEALFSAHMVQHLLLVLVAAPLLLRGTPPWLLRPLLRPRLLMRLARSFTHPLVAFVVFNAIFVGWHLPGAYDAALRIGGLHALEHVMMIASAILMWWPILSPLPELPRIAYPLQMLYFFLLALVQIPLFGIITFSDRIIYQSYADTPQLWGLSGLADQQLGGALMKIGSAGVFLYALIIVFLRWFRQAESETCDEHKRSGHDSTLTISQVPPVGQRAKGA